MTTATMNVVKLSKALPTHQGNISEIKFRPMTAELLIRNRKLPFTIKTDPESGEQSIDTDFALAAKYIADLTGHDEAVLGGLAPKDFSACIKMLGDLLAEAGN